MAAELHCTLLPRARLNETHLPRSEPKQHLVPHSNVEARIQLDMYRQPDEEVHDTEREERMSRLFSMRRDHAIVAAEIARRDSIHLELELVAKKPMPKMHTIMMHL